MRRRLQRSMVDLARKLRIPLPPHGIFTFLLWTFSTPAWVTLALTPRQRRLLTSVNNRLVTAKHAKTVRSLAGASLHGTHRRLKWRCPDPTVRLILSVSSATALLESSTRVLISVAVVEVTRMSRSYRASRFASEGSLRRLQLKRSS